MFHHIYHEMFHFFGTLICSVIECKIANIGVNLLGRGAGGDNFYFISFSTISMNFALISGLELVLFCSWLEPSLYEQVKGRTTPSLSSSQSPGHSRRT